MPPASLRLLPLLLALLSFCLPARSAESAVNSAVVPVAKPDANWLKRHEAMNALAAQGNIGLVYIGDSLVDHYNNQGKAVWAHYYAGRHALNLGIGGDRTEHVLWRLQHGNIAGLAPKLTIITIGQNNGGKNTGEEIAAGVTAIVGLVRDRLPDSKILLLGIFQRREKPAPERAVLSLANSIIARLADNRTIFYMDINYLFVAPDGTISRTVMYDFTHPTPLGHRLWAEAIEPKVAELMGETPIAPMPAGTP